MPDQQTPSTFQPCDAVLRGTPFANFFIGEIAGEGTGRRYRADADGFIQDIDARHVRYLLDMGCTVSKAWRGRIPEPEAPPTPSEEILVTLKAPAGSSWYCGGVAARSYRADAAGNLCVLPLHVKAVVKMGNGKVTA